MVKVVAVALGLALVVFLTLVALLGTAQDALGHRSIHRDVVKVQGYATCPEDERLVPVRHHGYVPERQGGWVYTCKPFDNRGKFAR